MVNSGKLLSSHSAQTSSSRRGNIAQKDGNHKDK